MNIRAIITGSTGMVGKSVLMECLESEFVDSVLVINRQTIGLEHPKLKEIIHSDFYNISTIKDELNDYNACFFCMGVSSVGKSEIEYSKITFDITKEFVDTLYSINSEMIFNYVSGAGTDSSEQGRAMWARVKGKTENMVLNKGFKDAYAFRPGAILPSKGVKSKTKWVNFLLVVLWPFYPLLNMMNSVTTSNKLGQAMIYSAMFPQNVKHIENKAMNELAGWFQKKVN